MSQETFREFIQRLWSEGSDNPFLDEALLHRLLEDGGHDTEDLSREIITSLLDEEPPKNWNTARFACSEVLGYYLVIAHQMSHQQMAASIFVTCVLADVSRADETTWDLEHNKVICLVYLLQDRIRVQDVLFILRYIFGKGGQSPTMARPSAMTHGSLRQLVKSLWSAGHLGLFSDDVLLTGLVEDGGDEATDLTLQVVTDLLDQKLPESWKAVTSAFSELLCIYLRVGHKMSFEQVIAAAFSACVLADAARAKGCNWSLEHDKVMALCAILGGRLELEKNLHLMTYIFGKGGQSPISE